MPRKRRLNPVLPNGRPFLVSDERTLWMEAACRVNEAQADALVFALRERLGHLLSEEQRDRAFYAQDLDGQSWPLQCAEPNCETLHPNMIESDRVTWFCPAHSDSDHADKRGSTEKVELWAKWCPNCHKVFALASDREKGDCPQCGNDLHPVGKTSAPKQEAFDFGMAIHLMKVGHRVARRGWNGKNMFVELQKPDEHSKMTLPYIFMKTVQGDLIPWLASQTDMLSDDWVLIPKEAK